MRNFLRRNSIPKRRFPDPDSLKRGMGRGGGWGVHLRPHLIANSRKNPQYLTLTYKLY